MKKIFIAVGESNFREKLASFLAHKHGLKIIGLAGSLGEASRGLEINKPDILLADYDLVGGAGSETTASLQIVAASCKLFFLAEVERAEDLFTAVRIGASGYLSKNVPLEKIAAAIRSVLAGEAAISRSMTIHLMGEFSRAWPLGFPADQRLSSLTSRELDVLREMAAGKKNLEIAASLYLAENTVKYHVHSILGKLDLPDRRAAMVFSRENRLFPG